MDYIYITLLITTLFILITNPNMWTKPKNTKNVLVYYLRDHPSFIYFVYFFFTNVYKMNNGYYSYYYLHEGVLPSGVSYQK